MPAGVPGGTGKVQAFASAIEVTGQDLSTVPFESVHSTLSPKVETVPVTLSCAVWPAKAGFVVMSKLVMSSATSDGGMSAKFTLYHIGDCTRFCAGAVCGVNERLSLGWRNSGEVKPE